MAEYANMVTVCSVATILFLGGWHAAVARAMVPIWFAPLISRSPEPLPVSRLQSGAPAG